jgi:hypothetical protein
MSDMHYGTFFVANAAGGLVWGTLYTLLGYFIGQKVEAATGVASYVVLGLIVVTIAVFVVRGRVNRKHEIGQAGESAPAPDQPAAPHRDEVGDESPSLGEGSG